MDVSNQGNVSLREMARDLINGGSDDGGGIINEIDVPQNGGEALIDGFNISDVHGQIDPGPEKSLRTSIGGETKPNKPSLLDRIRDLIGGENKPSLLDRFRDLLHISKPVCPPKPPIEQPSFRDRIGELLGLTSRPTENLQDAVGNLIHDEDGPQRTDWGYVPRKPSLLEGLGRLLG